MLIHKFEHLNKLKLLVTNFYPPKMPLSLYSAGFSTFPSSLHTASVAG